MPQFRCEIHQLIVGQSLDVVRCRFGWKGLRLRQFFTGNTRDRDRPFDDRPDGLAGNPVERVDERLFGCLRNNRHRLAIDLNIQQHRRSRHIVVPDVVMHHLVVPQPLTGFDIECNQAGAEEIVSRTEPTVEIKRGPVCWNVDNAAFLVGRQWCPGRNIARPLPRIIFPGVVTKFSRPRQDVELPQKFTGTGVVAEYVTRYVFDSRLVVTLFRRITHHDDIAYDNRWRRRSNVTRREIDPIVGVIRVAQVCEQIDDTGVRETLDGDLFAKPFQWVSGFRIERCQKEPRRDDVDDAATIDFRVGDAFTVILAHGVFPARRVGFAVRPQGLAVGRVNGDDMAARPRNGVEHAVYVGRRGTATAGCEACAIPNPGFFQIVEVIGVDLIGWQISSVLGVAPEISPLTILGASLRGHGDRRNEQQRHAKR